MSIIETNVVVRTTLCDADQCVNTNGRVILPDTEFAHHYRLQADIHPECVKASKVKGEDVSLQAMFWTRHKLIDAKIKGV